MTNRPDWKPHHFPMIAEAFTMAKTIEARAYAVRVFGAATVHAALVNARMRAETRTLDYQAFVAGADMAEPCTCKVCRVYGGDCAATLGAEHARETLFRWRRRSSASRAFAPKLRYLGGL